MVLATLATMTVWERARVLGLAPDASSSQAALTLLRSGSVREPGCRGSDPGALWGRWQGSGRVPYETVVELADPPAFACTCPSRKVPCKHALALMLRWSSGQVPPAEPPTYATTWLSARAERPAPREPRPAGALADPEAAAVRAAARAERVAAGLDELDRWLHDQVRTGLAGLERVGYAPFEAIAARMVDAQAPGVAGLVRGIPGELAREGWPERVLDAFGALHLLVEAHRRLPELDPGLAATVRSRVGYPVGKDDVLASPGVSDEWLALGMVDAIDYRLETRRVWLHGARTGRWAVLLSFAPPGGSFDSEVVAGDRLAARLHFYPGSGQLRALVADRTSTREPAVYPAGESWSGVQRRYAELLAADPWATRMPAVVRASPVPPGRAGEPWRLRDLDGAAADLVGLPGDPWLLLACSHGGVVDVFGEWSSRGLHPLSVLPAADGVAFSTAILDRAA